MSKKKVVSEAAAMLGRLGGLKGGRARAETLTTARRKEIAELGAKASNEGMTKAQRTARAKKAAATRYANNGGKRGAKKKVGAARSARARSRKTGS